MPLTVMEKPEINNKKSIVIEYGPLVNSICNRMIEDRDLAKDASQEIWIEVMNSLDSFEGKSKLSTWIYSISKRVIMRICRNEKKYSTEFLEQIFYNKPITLSFEDKLERKEWIIERCNKCLTAVLHCLESSSRLIFILRTITTLSYHDIAEIFDQNESAIRKAYSRSSRKIQNFMSQKCILADPDAKCRCRIKEEVLQMELPKEFEKFKTTLNELSLFYHFEILIPKSESWLEY